MFVLKYMHRLRFDIKIKPKTSKPWLKTIFYVMERTLEDPKQWKYMGPNKKA